MQCFAVKVSEIEGRVDPNPYHPIRISSIKRVRNSDRNILPLVKVAKFSSNVKQSNEEGLPYVGLENIESNTGIYLASKEEKREFGSAYRFSKGDILFPKLRPYLNKVFHANFEGYCSTEFYVLKSQKVTPIYLFAFLNSQVVVNQTACLMTGNTLPRLQTEEVKNILIPVCDNKVQNQVEECIKNAYAQKRQKEAEAETLLNSVDDYVLSELGITSPEIQHKTCFVAKAQEVQNSRMDAYYYQPKFELLYETLGNYGCLPLHKAINGSLVKGKLPKNEQKAGNAKVLQITHIDKNGHIDYDACIEAEEGIFQKKQKLAIGDVVIVITGATIGKIGCWQSCRSNFYLGGDLVKFQTNKENDPVYIKTVLSTPIGQRQIIRSITGATNGHLSPSDIENFLIPLPPLPTQQKIAREVQSRMTKAEQLKKEASEILEEAKLEVEKMILEEN